MSSEQSTEQSIHTPSIPGPAAVPMAPGTAPATTFIPRPDPQAAAGLSPVPAAPSSPVTAAPASAAAAGPPPIRVDPSLGAVVTLSDSDQLRLMTLEYSISESMAQGWRSFVDIGLSLIEIRRDELYAAEFPTFEDYCRVKWDFRHSKANYLMAAAQVFRSLAALPGVPKPERESPLRPLLSLKPEDAQRAWRLAVEKTGGRRITARVVKNAVQELNLAGNPANSRSAQTARVDPHQMITSCFSDLLILVSRRADYGAILAKVQELHGLVEGLFAKQQSKRQWDLQNPGAPIPGP